jgi:hypothetical protein
MAHARVPSLRMPQAEPRQSSFLNPFTTTAKFTNLGEHTCTATSLSNAPIRHKKIKLLLRLPFTPVGVKGRGESGGYTKSPTGKIQTKTQVSPDCQSFSAPSQSKAKHALRAPTRKPRALRISAPRHASSSAAWTWSIQPSCSRAPFLPDNPAQAAPLWRHCLRAYPALMPPCPTDCQHDDHSL